MEVKELGHIVLYVRDLEVSRGFYRDVLGLPLKFESPGWTEFATEGATLALHLSAKSNAAADDPNQVPAGRCRPRPAIEPHGVQDQALVGVQPVPAVREDVRVGRDP